MVTRNRKWSTIASLLLSLGVLLGLTVAGCTDKDRDSHGNPIDEATYSLYICPEGYSVNEDANSIVDADGNDIITSDIPSSYDIANGKTRSFVVICEKITDSEETYTVLNDAVSDLQVATQTDLITNAGFTVSVSEEAVPEIGAAILTAYYYAGEEILADTEVNINVVAASGYDAISILPPGYVVEDGELKDENGEAVDVDDVDPNFNITAPGDYRFVVVGMNENEDGTKTYTDVTNDAELALELETNHEEAFTIEDGAKLVVSEDVQDGDTATVKGTYGEEQLTAEINITVGEEPADYQYIRILPPGYSVDNGVLYDENGEEADIDMIDPAYTVTEPGEYTFVVIGYNVDDEGSKTYTDITSDEQLAWELSGEFTEGTVSLDNNVLTVAENAQDGENAQVDVTYGDTSLAANIQISLSIEETASYSDIRILPPGYYVKDGLVYDEKDTEVSIDTIANSMAIDVDFGQVYEFIPVGISEDADGNKTCTDLSGDDKFVFLIQGTPSEDGSVDMSVGSDGHAFVTISAEDKCSAGTVYLVGDYTVDDETTLSCDINFTLNPGA